jgi:hypothetical protein
MTEALASLGKSSVQNASAGSSAVAAGLPLVMGLALGPLGLLAGAQLGALTSELAAWSLDRGGLAMGSCGGSCCGLRQQVLASRVMHGHLYSSSISTASIARQARRLFWPRGSGC